MMEAAEYPVNQIMQWGNRKLMRLVCMHASACNGSIGKSGALMCTERFVLRDCVASPLTTHLLAGVMNPVQGSVPGLQLLLPA